MNALLNLERDVWLKFRVRQAIDEFVLTEGWPTPVIPGAAR
jgi:hypothetical protein